MEYPIFANYIQNHNATLSNNGFGMSELFYQSFSGFHLGLYDTLPFWIVISHGRSKRVSSDKEKEDTVGGLIFTAIILQCTLYMYFPFSYIIYENNIKHSGAKITQRPRCISKLFIPSCFKFWQAIKSTQCCVLCITICWANRQILRFEYHCWIIFRCSCCGIFAPWDTQGEMPIKPLNYFL